MIAAVLLTPLVFRVVDSFLDSNLSDKDSYSSVTSMVIGLLSLLATTVLGIAQLRRSSRHHPAASPPEPTPRAEQPVPRTADALPTVWNIPARNPAFIARESTLESLRRQFRSAEQTRVQVIHGMGGIGKTQVAIEYAHRRAADFDLAWWIDADDKDLIAGRIARLAVAAEWCQETENQAAALAAVHRGLQARNRWLIIFDNVEHPDDLGRLLPQGPGDILITTRHPHWVQLGHQTELGLFTTVESTALLRTHRCTVDNDDARRLAYEVGNLPLAVAQAAGVIAETGMTVDEYLAGLTSGARTLLDEGRPLGYPATLGAATEMAVGRLRSEDDVAHRILMVCSWMSAEPIPIGLLLEIPGLSHPQRQPAADRAALRRCLGRIGRLGLARISGESVELHRLTLAIIRDLQRTIAPPAALEDAITILRVAFDRSAAEGATSFPALPHALAVVRNAHECDFRPHRIEELALAVGEHLLDRIDARPAIAILERELTAASSDRESEPDIGSGAILGMLARGYYFTGQLELARSSAERCLSLLRSRLGPDDPALLDCLGILGAVEKRSENWAESERHIRTCLRISRSAYGPSHPSVAIALGDLANLLRRQGARQEAARLHEQALEIKLAEFGRNHLETAVTMANLARVHEDLANFDEAERLLLDVLAIKRDVLHVHHPEIALTLIQLARLNDAQGRADAADEQRRAARALLAETPDHEDDAALWRMASLILRAGSPSHRGDPPERPTAPRTTADEG